MLSTTTKHAIKSMSVYDGYIARSLKKIADKVNHPVPLSALDKIELPFYWTWSIFNPLKALGLASSNTIEQQVKDLFLYSVKTTLRNVHQVQNEALQQEDNLDKINKILVDLKGKSDKELNLQPNMGILRALWVRTRMPEDWKQYKSHGSLLEELTTFYRDATDVVKQTTERLRPLLLKEPMEVLIAMFQNASHDLEAAKKDLEKIEGGR
jgi:hypothetical protein